MKTILIGSMGRCGSTLLTKIVIEMLKLNGFKVNGFEHGKNNILKRVDYNVVKLHHDNDIKYDYLLTCVRDIREIMASTKKLIRKIDKWAKGRRMVISKDDLINDFQEHFLEKTIDQIEFHDYWIEKSDFCFKFEDYVYDGYCDFEKYNDTLSNLLKINKVDTNLLRNNVNEQKDNITLKKVGVNEYSDILTVEQIDKINDNCTDFLKKYKYLK